MAHGAKLVKLIKYLPMLDLDAHFVFSFLHTSLTCHVSALEQAGVFEGESYNMQFVARY